MGHQVWQKLVRDFVPDMLKLKGISVESSVIGDFIGRDRFGRKKLVEEANEVLKAETPEEFLAELADLDEVKVALMRLHHITLDQLEAAKRRKREAIGGFERWIHLESTDEPDKPNGQQ